MTESKEFTAWWNANFSPDETGRTRTVAAHAFEAGYGASSQRPRYIAPIQPPALDDARGPMITDTYGKITDR